MARKRISLSHSRPSVTAEAGHCNTTSRGLVQEPCVQCLACLDRSSATRRDQPRSPLCIPDIGELASQSICRKLSGSRKFREREGTIERSYFVSRTDFTQSHKRFFNRSSTKVLLLQILLRRNGSFLVNPQLKSTA